MVSMHYNKQTNQIKVVKKPFSLILQQRAAPWHALILLALYRQLY